MLDNQPWHQQATYRAKSLQSWYYQSGKLHLKKQDMSGRIGGQWKGDSKLAIFTVEDAGHLSPGENPEAVQSVVDYWIR
jgi:hypothetical protein